MDCQFVGPQDGSERQCKNCGHKTTREAIMTTHQPECPAPVYAVTISEIYGKPMNELTAPPGYEFTGEFRIVKEYELGMAIEYLPGQFGISGKGCLDPRLIICPRKRLRVVFEESPSGDWYQRASGEFYQCKADPPDWLHTKRFNRREESIDG